MIHEINTTPNTPRLSSTKLFLAIFSFIVLLGVGLYVIKSIKANQASLLPQVETVISQNTLQDKYGLRVILVAVTAGGGLVDVRLKIVDADKARQFLGTDPNYPALKIADSGTSLVSAGDSRTQFASLGNGEVAYLIFPNSKNAVKPGTRVSLMFPSARLEPIPAQ